MKHLLSRATLAFAVIASASMMAQNSAYASLGAAVVGGGTITPGLTANPTFQSGTFSGTIAAAVNAQTAVAAGTGTCSFTFGSTIAETVLQGQGTASGTCSGGDVGSYTITCVAFIYVRVGPIVVIVEVGNCRITATGPTGSGANTGIAGGGVFLFVPTSGNGATAPVTGYELAGVAAVTA